MFFCLIEPYILTPAAIPGRGDPFLFPIHRIFMTEESNESQIAIRAFSIIGILVVFTTNRIHKRVRSNSVEKIAFCTTPCCGNPCPFPINGFVLVQPNCFSSALRTFLFYTRTTPLFFVCIHHPKSCAGLKDSYEKIVFSGLGGIRTLGQSVKSRLL